VAPRALVNSAGTISFVIPGRALRASPESIIPVIVMAYYVYLLASKKHDTLYLGVTNDIVRRPGMTQGGFHMRLF
jgi:hypothetical protein